jgi:hypothetical protein
VRNLSSLWLVVVAVAGVAGLALLARPGDRAGALGNQAAPGCTHLDGDGYGIGCAAGYELIQDYDAILWTSELEGHKPIVMSGVRAGAWYRGGPPRHGLTWAAGGLLTLATPALSLAQSPDGLDDHPNGLDGHTTILDLGADVTLGHVWEGFRLEAFATPAWSCGVVRSPAIWKEETYSAFTYRFGVSLAILVDS